MGVKKQNGGLGIKWKFLYVDFNCCFLGTKLWLSIITYGLGIQLRFRNNNWGLGTIIKV